MKILALDSSATAASVALLEDEFIIGEFYIHTKRTHSQTLLPMIDALLTNTSVSINEIDLFAVSNGPGSFTGIRIGVAAIKGMAMALKKPCVAVSTLWAMAAMHIDKDGMICAVMDARCNQVYNALFRISKGKIERMTEDRAILIDDLKNELTNYEEIINLVGDGSILCYNNFGSLLENVRLSAEQSRYQKAFGVGMVGLEKYRLGEIVSAEELLPSYLRLPQAERELKKRLSLKGVK